MREWLIRLSLLAFGFLIILMSLLVIEYYLSKFAPHRKASDTRGFHEPDKYIGYKGIPGKAKEWRIGRIKSYVRMNSHGFRDRERNYEKGKDVYRIVVLGDSYTEALQVPLEETFPYILEEKLNSESAKEVFEVLNLGVSGFSTAQEYLTLKHYGLRYHPNFVILVFFNNDVFDNSLILQSKFKGIKRDDIFRPYFVLNNGKLEKLQFKVRTIDESRQQTGRGREGIFQSLKHSFPNIYYSLRDRLNETPWLGNFMWEIGVRKSKPKLHSESKGLEFSIRFGVHADPNPPHWQGAWDITNAIILKLANELEMNNIEFLVVFIPNLDNLYKDKFGSYDFVLPREWDEYTQNGVFRFDLRKPERVLSNFFEANNIEYLLLRPEFEKYVGETGKNIHFPYEYESHWNANGHALAAQVIYQKLKDEILSTVPIRD